MAIGVWAARRTRDERDFWIAGQRTGLFVTGIATMSAAFSGFVFLGGPGLTYRIGLASLWINVSVSFTAVMLCWVLAKRLRLLAGVREIYTVPDAVAARYRSRWAQGLAAAAVLAGSVAYLGAQLQALAVLGEAVFGTRELFGDAGFAVAMGVGLTIVVLYSVAGGMVAGIYTDFVQGLLMLAAAGAVFFVAIQAGGGWGEVARTIAESPTFGPDFLDPFGRVPAATALGFFFVFSIGTLGQPHMLHKLYMLDDPKKLRWFPAVLAGSQVVCLALWLGIGLAVPALVARGAMAPLEDPDQAAPLFLLGFVPEPLAGLVLAGALAAIMSTADSFLNLGAAALVRDLPRALGRTASPGASEGLSRARWAVVAVAVVAALCATAYGDLIALLGTFAFGTFGAALTPCLAVGLNWRRATPAAAVASIATGLGGTVGLEMVSRLPGSPLAGWLPGVLPAAVSLAASFVVFLGVSWVTGSDERDDLDPDVARVMDA